MAMMAEASAEADEALAVIAMARTAARARAKYRNVPVTKGLIVRRSGLEKGSHRSSREV